MVALQSWTVALVAIALGTSGWMRRREIAEAIRNFRGGPPTPMHPSPANDAALLRKRRVAR